MHAETWRVLRLQLGGGYCTTFHCHDGTSFTFVAVRDSASYHFAFIYGENVMR